MKPSPFTHRLPLPLQVYRRPRRWPTWLRRTDVMIFAAVTIYSVLLNTIIWFALIPS